MVTMSLLVLVLVGLWSSSITSSQTISSEKRVNVCPTFWTSFEGSCYRLISQPDIWRNAEAKCHELGAAENVSSHLVSIHNEDENDFLLQYLESTFVDQLYFQELVDSGILIVNDNKPHNYNALWIGSLFSKWSDKTGVGFALWLNENSTDVCGHMWTSSRFPERHGKWDKTDCFTELPFICKFRRQSEGDQSLPCTYRGYNLEHKEIIGIDKCTFCACHDAKVSCYIASCPPPTCSNPIGFTDLCCDVCPYDVPVYNVDIIGVKPVQYGTENDITVDLEIAINGEGGHANGTNLWKVSMWASERSDGLGRRIGFSEQLLNDEKASKSLTNPQPSSSSGYYMSLPDINFKLSPSAEDCRQELYLCASFNMGNTPKPRAGNHVIPLSVFGVQSESDTTSNPQNLIKCEAFPRCGPEVTTNNRACISYGTTLSHKQVKVVDQCELCTCFDSRLTCYRWSCIPTTCRNPLQFPDQCCDVCPYDVPVRNVYVYGLNPIESGSEHNITVDLEIAVEHNRGGNANGTDLWKVGMWVSERSDGFGRRVGFKEQVLTDSQASLELVKPNTVSDYYLSIPDVTFNLDASGKSCRELQYLCASFSRGDNAEPRAGPHTVPFSVFGTRQNALQRCEPFPRCGESSEGQSCTYLGNLIQNKQSYDVDDCQTCHCTEGQVRCNVQSCPTLSCPNGLDPVSIQDECCDICPYDLPIYRVRIEGATHVKADTLNNFRTQVYIETNDESQILIRQMNGTNLWKLGMWASAYPDGSGEKVGYVNQVLNDTEASQRLEKTVVKVYTPPRGYVSKPGVRLNANYRLDTSGATCEKLKFICVSFNRGDFARPHGSPNIPLNVYGVESATDLTPNSDHLIGCSIPFPTCTDLPDREATKQSCSSTIPHGRSVPSRREGVTCFCNDGDELCFGVNCPDTLTCEAPVKVDQYFCELCTPFDVPLYRIELLDVTSVEERTTNNLTVNLRVAFNQDFHGAQGNNLWKVSMWASEDQGGYGDRIGFQEQVLTNIQSGTDLRRSPTKTDFTFRGIGFNLNASDTSCTRLRYLCATFDQGDNPDTQVGTETIPFRVYSVESETDSTPNPYNRLIGCQPFTECKAPSTGLPCGTNAHGETYKLAGYDGCLTCTCNNGQQLCSYIKCPNLHCVAPTSIEGECCDVCSPFNIPVYGVELVGVDSVTAGETNKIDIDLQVLMNSDGGNAQGSGLWKVGMWISKAEDGSGEKVAYQEQVLTDEQASQDIVKIAQNGGETFIIPGITYSVDSSDRYCLDMKYLCASFSMGDEPDTQIESLNVPFSVYGVQSEFDSTPNPGNLIGCQRFTDCTSAQTNLPCTYKWATFNDQDTFTTGDCTDCSCDNGSIYCNFRSCQQTFCDAPVRIEGACCDICTPFDVPVHGVGLVGVESVVEGTANDINVDLQVALHRDGANAEGSYLWKVAMWASANPDGSGDKMGLRKQVLTNEQASKYFFRDRFKHYTFVIRNITFDLDTSAASCSELRYLCAEFNQGDAPHTQVGSQIIPFSVYGVEGESDSTPNPDNLIGCQAFTRCDANAGNCDYRGQNIQMGQSLIVDECTTCYCAGTKTRCDIVACPPTNCQNPVQIDGECCESCGTLDTVGNTECTYKGQTLQIGETLRVDDCISCFCEGTQTRCDIQNCPTPDCPNPVMIDGECCESCSPSVAGSTCGFRGQTIQMGQRLVVDDCITCYCEGSRTRCDIVACPATNCQNPVKTDGECCERCPFDTDGDVLCDYRGQTILTGQTLVVDDCISCFCEGSRTRCDIQSCPTPDCQNPVKIDGECCETCSPLGESSSCNFREETIQMGDRLVVDDCITCYCEGSQTRCDIVACPPINCQNPVKIYGQCCERCPLDTVENTVCDYRGQIIRTGQTLIVDDCISCFCDGNRTRCDIKSCPTPDCQNPVKIAGECCETCNPLIGDSTCDFRGQILLKGQRLIVDHCTTCFCEGSTTRCDIIACPATNCQNPVPVEGECCERCPFDTDSNPVCNYKGQTIQIRETLRVDDCISCFCEGNKTRCNIQTCPTADCQNPVKIAGECCETCSQTVGDLTCDFRGQTIQTGERLTVDDCTTCYCEGSQTRCDIVACPATNCQNPVKIKGECCERCPFGAIGVTVCEYKGQTIRFGETLRVDDCISCFCDGSRTRCDIQSCPTLDCENPRTVDGECCDTCSPIVGDSPCDFRGQTLLPGQRLIVDDCTTCYCEGNKTRCDIIACSPTNCQNPIKTDGECCESCSPFDAVGETVCDYKGQIITMGETLRVDDCISCFCDGSQTRCDIQSCPTLDCKNPRRVDGECCETCSPLVEDSTCDFRGQIILLGQKLIVDECTTCYCDGTRTRCDIVACPTTNCQNPRKIDGECCESCSPFDTVGDPVCNYKGLTISAGERLRVDDCISCFCVGNQTRCDIQTCPTLDCQNHVTIAGECCATCSPRVGDLACEYRGQTIQTGERLTVDECTTCYCEGDKTRCDIIACPQTNCRNPTYIDGECCATCSPFDATGTTVCVYKGQTIPMGQTLVVDDCISCVCEGSVIRCDIEVCPATSCQNPLKIAGECCETCSPLVEDACDFRGQTILSGQRLIVDDCITCYCEGSRTRCDIVACPPSNCQNPVKVDGECCETCSSIDTIGNTECTYKGQTIQMGERLRVDDCISCFCEGNQTRCDIVACPPTNCQNPVKIGVECCETCSQSAESSTCDFRGQTIQMGERLTVDDCTTCYCEGTQTRCDIVACPATNCQHPAKVEGECCETCGPLDTVGNTECDYRGQIIRTGQTLVVDDCISCFCDGNRTRCDIQSCPTPGCQNPVKIAGECCQTCRPSDDDLSCDYRGQTILMGQRLIVDDCTTCYCEGSNTRCDIVACPATNCQNPVMIDGECCERCGAFDTVGNTECTYRGQIIRTGGTLRVDDCISCFCEGSQTRCDIRNCPTPDCDNPVRVDGKCCETCSPIVGRFTCEYRGQPIQAGQRLAVDDCTTCYCDGITTRCDIQNCFTTYCQNPVKIEGHCCEVCSPLALDLTCDFRGQTIETGERLVMDDCTTCYCEGSKTLCDIVACPATNCRNPVKTDGECCERCGPFDTVGDVICDYRGQTIKPGQTLVVDDCISCFCEGTRTRCDIQSCPATNCQNPVKIDGECCESCGPLVGGSTCEYRGQTIQAGETLVVDDCISCHCEGSITRCDIRACHTTYCVNPTKLSDECCEICYPFDIPVYGVNLIRTSSVKAGTANNIDVDVQVLMNREAQNAEGTNIWKVSMWASSNIDGSGERIGYQQQVLTSEQASKHFHRSTDKKETFIIPGIAFNLDASNKDCTQLQFVCAEFNQGDAPDTQVGSQNIPFSVYGVEGETDSTKNAGNLLGCAEFVNCNDNPFSTSGTDSCSYQGIGILHGEVFEADPCVICGCNGSSIECTIKGCPPTFCLSPLVLSGQCCDLCPYDVPVHNVDLQRVRYVTPNAMNQMNVDLEIGIHMFGDTVEGTGLWKVGMWASNNDIGNRDKIGYTEQVLTEEQASTKLARPSSFGGFVFTIPDITFDLDATSASCDQLRYLCASFSKGDTPDTRLGSNVIPFKVYGVQSDLLPQRTGPDILIGCTSFTQCKEGVQSPYLPCSYAGANVEHLASIPLDKRGCSFCSCNDSTIQCTYISCPRCFGPIFFTVGVCCPDCPNEPPSTGNTLPRRCQYEGRSILHDGVLRVDRCTTCVCNDGTVTCEIQSCKDLLCTSPIRLPNECCDVCPYYVPVYNVNLLGNPMVKAGTMRNLNVDLEVSLNREGVPVKGVGLWRVDMWASESDDPNGKKIGYIYQVLTDSQASASLQKSAPGIGSDFLIPNINFNLNTSGVPCKSLRYLCAKFSVGDTPDTRVGTNVIPMRVYGVESEYDSTFNRDAVTGCSPITECKESVDIKPRPCKYGTTLIVHGHIYNVDECTACMCSDSTMTCRTDPRCGVLAIDPGQHLVDLLLHGPTSFREQRP